MQPGGGSRIAIAAFSAASVPGVRRLPLNPRCTSNQETRKISRSRHESARQLARDIAKTAAYFSSSYARKTVEMLFAYLKRILRLDRLRFREPNSAKDEFHLAATAQNLANSPNCSRCCRFRAETLAAPPLA